jgi:hypothetical protein
MNVSDSTVAHKEQLERNELYARINASLPLMTGNDFIYDNTPLPHGSLELSYFIKDEYLHDEGTCTQQPQSNEYSGLFQYLPSPSHGFCEFSDSEFDTPALIFTTSTTSSSRASTAVTPGLTTPKDVPIALPWITGPSIWADPEPISSLGQITTIIGDDGNIEPIMLLQRVSPLKEMVEKPIPVKKPVEFEPNHLTASPVLKEEAMDVGETSDGSVYEPDPKPRRKTQKKRRDNVHKQPKSAHTDSGVGGKRSSGADQATVMEGLRYLEESPASAQFRTTSSRSPSLTARLRSPKAQMLAPARAVAFAKTKPSGSKVIPLPPPKSTPTPPIRSGSARLPSVLMKVGSSNDPGTISQEEFDKMMAFPSPSPSPAPSASKKSRGASVSTSYTSFSPGRGSLKFILRRSMSKTPAPQMPRTSQSVSPRPLPQKVTAALDVMTEQINSTTTEEDVGLGFVGLKMK